jgi:predicted site-specific integrase-resolvase
MSVDLLKAGEAAGLLRRHPCTLDRWRRRGYGPVPLAIGGHWFYQLAEIETFLDTEQQRYRANHLASVSS